MKKNKKEILKTTGRVLGTAAAIAVSYVALEKLISISKVEGAKEALAAISSIDAVEDLLTSKVIERGKPYFGLLIKLF